MMFSQRKLDKNTSYYSSNNLALTNNKSILRASSKNNKMGSRNASTRNLANASKLTRTKKREKRDLVEETLAIREQVHSMKLIKRYD